MEKELILLSKLQFFNEKYNKQIFAIFKLCSEMKNYVTTFYAKNQRNFIEMKNGDKYIETSFNFNGIMFFIRLWYFCGNSKKDVSLYTIYNNDYNRFYINVEVSKHTIKKDFMDKMRKALEQKYLYYTYVKFCSLFNDDERNELNRKMTEIPKPSYALDDMATNEELCKMVEKYSEEQLNAFLEVLIYDYHEALSHVEMEHFDMIEDE